MVFYGITHELLLLATSFSLYVFYLQFYCSWHTNSSILHLDLDVLLANS